jgi:hypothetical protein
MAEPMPEPEPEPEPMAEPTAEPAPEPSALANEFKTINTVQSPDPDPVENEDVLFDDAADERTKKVGYN